MKKLLLVFACLGVGGCSATSLRCSVDGDSSFVELLNFPQDISSQSRHFKDLCAFSFDADPVPQVRILDSAVTRTDLTDLPYETLEQYFPHVSSERFYVPHLTYLSSIGEIEPGKLYRNTTSSYETALHSSTDYDR